MAYWLDDNWEGSPRIHEVGMAAWGMYCACGLWVARHLTDGHVPRSVVATYGSSSRSWAKRLVEAGLFVVTETGYYMPDYLALNPSAERVAYQRKLAAERVRRHRGKSCP